MVNPFVGVIELGYARTVADNKDCRLARHGLKRFAAVELNGLDGLFARHMRQAAREGHDLTDESAVSVCASRLRMGRIDGRIQICGRLGRLFSGYVDGRWRRGGRDGRGGRLRGRFARPAGFAFRCGGNGADVKAAGEDFGAAL